MYIFVILRFFMKTKVITLKKKETSVRTASKDDAFEEDWKNGISGDEFLKEIQSHIKKLYASKAKN